MVAITGALARSWCAYYWRVWGFDSLTSY